MDDEINLKDYLDVVLRQWATIAAVAVISVVIAFVVSVLTRPAYEAKANILIRSSSGGSTSQLAGLASLAGINMGGGGGSNIGDLNELLKTKAVSRDVKKEIEDVSELMNRGHLDRAALDLVEGGSTEAPAGTDLGKMKAKIDGNFLAITVEHKSPVLAARIADAYVDALSVYWNKLNFSEARKKKEYIEKQLPIAEASLRLVESKIKNMTYLVAPAAGGLSSQPETVDIARLKREYEIQSSVYIMLRKEYESAKLDEAREMSPFTDVERAEVPAVPSKPKLQLNLIVGSIAGLFLGIFIAFAKDAFTYRGK